MKPDQHKKKKNLQYKKKHGITDSKSVAKGDEQNTNRNKDNKKGACGKGLPDKITQKQALVKSDSDNTASDDETVSSVLANIMIYNLLFCTHNLMRALCKWYMILSI